MDTEAWLYFFPVLLWKKAPSPFWPSRPNPRQFLTPHLDLSCHLGQDLAPARASPFPSASAPHPSVSHGPCLGFSLSVPSLAIPPLPRRFVPDHFSRFLLSAAPVAGREGGLPGMEEGLEQPSVRLLLLCPCPVRCAGLALQARPPHRGAHTPGGNERRDAAGCCSCSASGLPCTLWCPHALCPSLPGPRPSCPGPTHST